MQLVPEGGGCRLSGLEVACLLILSSDTKKERDYTRTIEWLRVSTVPIGGAKRNYIIALTMECVDLERQIDSPYGLQMRSCQISH